MTWAPSHRALAVVNRSLGDDVSHGQSRSHRTGAQYDEHKQLTNHQSDGLFDAECFAGYSCSVCRVMVDSACIRQLAQHGHHRKIQRRVEA